MSVDRIGWVTFWFLAALGFVFGCVGLAHGAAPTLTERMVLVQPSIASVSDKPVDATQLAEAIARVPHVTREWAALMLAVAAHESALSDRIRRGECRPRECDGGAAWSLWQQHRNKLNGASWGSTDIGVQTAEAARALRRSFYRCNGGSRKLGPDWVARTVSAYAGLPCDAVWPGLKVRLATYERVRSRL
jgi:hypothetical protein